MSSPKGKVKIHISLSRTVIAVSDKVLTPPGFIEPIKGAYSQLIEMLLQQHFERMLGAGIFDISEYFETNQAASTEDAINYFKSLAESGGNNGTETI